MCLLSPLSRACRLRTDFRVLGIILPSMVVIRPSQQRGTNCTGRGKNAKEKYYKVTSTRGHLLGSLCTCHRLPRGGGGPRADVGTLLIVHFKVLVFPHPWAKPNTQLDLKMHFRTLFWLFEQLANTRTLHSDENWNFNYFFLNTP